MSVIQCKKRPMRAACTLALLAFTASASLGAEEQPLPFSHKVGFTATTLISRELPVRTAGLMRSTSKVILAPAHCTIA